MNGSLLNGRIIYCGRAQKRKERNIELQRKYEMDKLERYTRYQGVNLYVKNLEDEVDDEKLRKEFNKFGNITSAKVSVCVCVCVCVCVKVCRCVGAFGGGVIIVFIYIQKCLQPHSMCLYMNGVGLMGVGLNTHCHCTPFNAQTKGTLNAFFCVCVCVHLLPI